MTELLLMRHGKSDWEQELPDFDRPITDRGKRDAQRVGEWLRRETVLPDRIVTSPALRARETAEKTAKAAGLPATLVDSDSRLYGADAETILAIANAHGEGRLLLVGHNPGIELAVLALSDNPAPQPDGKLVTTANVARFRRGDAGYELLELVRPDDLPRKFAFTTEHGTEYRKRPSYYYSQSGVIPYRFRDGQIEFLLVTTGKGKWSIPKGIVEPGMSPIDSAAKEALEEGGLIGAVEERLMGSLTVQKWGADCNLKVYAMAVSRLLDEEDWREKHKRDRQWFSLDRAQRSINLELGTILGQLNEEKKPASVA